MITHGPIGLFGKIPAQGDFLRLNVGDPAVPVLARWLEDGNEALHRAGCALAPDPLGFVFRTQESERALVGALGPGTDKVGRSFPLAVFAPVPARELAARFPVAPMLYRRFFEGAVALFSDVRGLTAAQIPDRLRALPLPGPAELAEAEKWAGDAGRGPARDMQRRLFADPPEGQQYYAFRTFQTACQPVRGRDPGRAGLALDCPCVSQGDTYAWLELARRVLAWPVPPPFFWRNGAAPALLISLGTPPATLLPFLASPQRESNKIWPLRTRQAQAIATARKSFSSAQLGTIDGADVTVDELIASLSR